MTDLAENVSKIIYFGEGFYLIYRIVQNKKILTNKKLLEEHMEAEQEARIRYLHEKSGGTLLNNLLLLLLFLTMAAALFHMAAFDIAFTMLAAAIIFKATSYSFYSHR